MKNKRFCFISPKHNPKLTYKGKEIEAWFFYEYWAYNMIPDNLGPFCLNKGRFIWFIIFIKLYEKFKNKSINLGG